MITRFLFLGIVIFSLAGCSRTSTEEQCVSDLCLKQRAYDKVIAVHDEVMPKLSEISELKGRIEKRMNAATDSTEAANWRNLMVNLDEADDAMWVWMRQFNSDLDEVPVEEALAYLKEQQVEIDGVANLINEAMMKAQKALE